MDQILTTKDLKEHCEEQIKKQYKISEHELILCLINANNGIKNKINILTEKVKGYELLLRTLKTLIDLKM